MSIGVVGLGKMGSRIAAKLLADGHELVVWNRSEAPIEELKSKIQNHKFQIAKTIEDLINKLEKPRVIWLMLPAHSTDSASSLQAGSGRAGSATEEVLEEVSRFIEKGDTVIDGGNSYYKDTEKRYQDFKKKGIKFLGIGVSGGIIAEKEGYPMMVGGDKNAYEFIKPILDALAKPNGGFEYFGEGGAGHFIKMVHNAIEYGTMQSIGEGFGVLEKSPYDLDLVKVAKLYQKGTLVSGFMMERTIEVLEKDSRLSKITGIIGKASGETIWAVEEAKKNNLPIEIIQRSLEIRNKSQTNLKIQRSFAARMVSALRNAFGGHSVSQA